MMEKTETYQKTTSALCASGYSKLGTQEAMNDMFVVSCNWDGSQIAPTLTANNAGGAQRMPDKGNINAVISCETYHCESEDGITQTLKARDFKDPQTVCYSTKKDVAAVDCRNGKENPEVNGTLQSKSSGGYNLNCQNVCRDNFIVRRLTPLECTRLQGFPDKWVDIGDWTDSKGKVHKESDSVKYKALGNSIALPFWEWMAKRMAKILRDDGVENPTMASLFDGIGGFPLVYSRAGVEPIWASEIEEFPIAVTKKRFGED